MGALNAEGYYQLNSGMTITNLDISEKMDLISQRKPETDYKNSATGYSWNESGMAQLFAECYNANTRYCPEAKSWYTYDNGAWRKDIGAHLVSSKITEFYQIMILYCSELDEDSRNEYLKFLTKVGTRRFRENILKEAADNELLRIYGKQFDSNPFLINCLNGTFDLIRREFREPDWRDFLTMQTNFEYTLESAICPRWIKFINEVTEGNKEKAKYLQKALGYSILGMANEECMFILHGKTTRNGKSTLLSAIHHLLGDYAAVAPVSIICKTDRQRDGEAPSPVLAGLKGRRFVSMSESNQNGRLDEEIIKQFTGGEEITARHLHERPITFLPQFTLWLSCNDLPSVSDKSLFASDRIRVIEFNRHFSADEQDKNLKNEFQEMEMMQGIFCWLVEGFYDYMTYGLKMPPDMAEVVKEYRRDNDIVLQFLEDRCEMKEDVFTKQKSLYDNYKIWCKSNGYYSCSAKRFNAELETHPEWHGGKCTRDGYPGYRNLALKEELM